MLNITFEVEGTGVDSESGMRSTVYFQTEHTYDEYTKNRLPSEYGFTLASMDDGGDEYQLVFWFDDRESKAQWISENVTLISSHSDHDE